MVAAALVLLAAFSSSDSSIARRRPFFPCFSSAFAPFPLASSTSF